MPLQESAQPEPGEEIGIGIIGQEVSATDALGSRPVTGVEAEPGRKGVIEAAKRRETGV